MTRFPASSRRRGGTAFRVLGALIATQLACAGVQAEPGELDPGFGTDGRALVDFGAGVAGAVGMASLPDGRIVLAGIADGVVTNDACAVAVLLPDGTPDPAFGTDGRVELDFDPGRVNTCEGVAVQPDGRIVLVGSRDGGAVGGGRDFMVIRLLADGALDESFSDNGYAFANFALPGPFVRSIDEAHAVALQADGAIVVAGRAERSASNYDVAVARFLADGSLDGGFGTNGRFAFGIDDDGPTHDEAWSVAIQDNGRIVVAGTIGPDTDRMMVARLSADGDLDASFNLVGHRLIPFGFAPDSFGRGLAIRGDGSILVGGYAGNTETADFAVAAVRSDGTLDPDFGIGGRVMIDLGAEDGAFALAVDSAGRIALGGVRIANGNVDMAAVRLMPDGALDAAFGDAGQVIVPFDLDGPPGNQDVARAIVVQADDSVVLGGVATVSGAPLGADFAAVRLQGNGVRDTLFEHGFDDPVER